MEVQGEKKGDRYVLTASGRFDAAGAKVVAEALERAMAGGSHTVELDMGGVEYLSSAGIRVLVTYHQRFSQLRGSMVLTSVTDRICRLMEMTGLYELLDSPEGREDGVPGLLQIREGGWSMTTRTLEEDGRLLLRTIGTTIPGNDQPAAAPVPQTLPFPPGVLAFGTGALGYDAADCAGREGPFLAAGGYAAFGPPGSAPDFCEYAEAYAPKLHVLSAVALAGNFSRQITFESNESPPNLLELGAACADAAAAPAAGFVLAAECEIPAAVLSLPAGTGNGPCGVTSADGNRLCLVLVAGIVRVSGGPQTGTAITATGHSITAHAAIFTYRPLRRHGTVKLKDTADFLFALDLLDVISSGLGASSPLVAEMRLLRGLAWTAPVQERPS